MDGDVAAERQLNVVERLLVRMPRGRGFRVHTDGSVSVYPTSSRARLPAEKQKSSPRLSKREPRSEEAESERAANARTRRSAARAAKRAERREQAKLRLQQLACNMAKVLRWKRRQEVWTAWMRDKTAPAPAPSLAQPAAPAPAPAAPPPPAPSSPDVRMPRGRGFRVHTDGSVSVYPASSRARLPAEKQKSSPRLSKRDRARRRRRARVLRTHAPAAALHARRSAPRGVSRRNFACSSSPAIWRSCSVGRGARKFGPPGCGTRRPPPPPPA